MEEAILICPSCGKQNPENARFCYACGAILAAEGLDVSSPPSQPAGVPFDEAGTQTPEVPYAQTQPQYVQPIPQAAPPPAYSPPSAPQGYPPVGYPPTYPQQVYPPSKPPRRGRVRCCAIGCLVVLLVLLIGLPILHVTVLRPIIEREIYKQVQKSLEDVNQDEDRYYGTDSETITERKLNGDAQDVWDYIPGSSDGYIYLQQDQIKLEVKIYGVKVWAAADMRVDNRGEFVVKSVQMHWLLHTLFSEGALKREIADYANDKVLRPNMLSLLAFQVNEGKLYIAYEGR
jgi:hypothetical protein